MGFYEDRNRPVSDHERQARGRTVAPSPAPSREDHERAERGRVEDAVRLAPLGFGGLGLLMLPELVSGFGRSDPFVAGLALTIVVGMAGAAAMFLKRPPRIVAIVWLILLAGALGLSWRVTFGAYVVPFRLYAIGLAITCAAAIWSLTERAWRPPELTWEE